MANETQSHTNVERICIECNDAFVYTIAEQRFRNEQGMTEPTRCPDCRADRRAQRNADLLNGDGTSHSGEHRDRNRRRQGRGTGHSNPQDRHPAICADCGESTMVPFIPRGDRPVYCRNCFNARRGR